MDALTIQVTDSPNIAKALGISEDRGQEIFDALNAEIDAIFEGEDEGGRATDLAKSVVDKLKPNANELFYIGIKIGEMVEKQAIMGIIQSAAISRISPSDLFKALLGSVDEE